MKKRTLYYTVLPILMFIGIHTTAHAGTVLGNEETTRLGTLEDSLVVLADSMSNAIMPDDRIDFCIRFTKYMREAMEIPGSINYPFKKLETKIHILYPEDKSFRIFNWMIAPATTVRRYYGAVQMNSETPKYFPLKDYHDKMDRQSETTVAGPDKWYGCEIYKIMPQVIQGQKVYILFGFNSDGANSNKKIIDVLTITSDNVTLGAPIFAMPNIQGRMEQTSRVVLEYKKTAQVFLNYDNERRMIIFNRLASEVTDPNRKSTYIPTGQMDGLRFENGMFVFVKDAVPVLKLQDGQAPIDGVMKGG